LPLLDRSRGLRERDGFERRLSSTGAAHYAGRGEAPAAVHQRSNTDPVRLVIADTAHLAFTRRDRLTTVTPDAYIGI